MPSGERQILLSFWTEGGHRSIFATKEGITMDKTVLSLVGFTQPDMTCRLLEEMTSLDDGLVDQ